MRTTPKAPAPKASAKDARVTALIKDAAPFARPVLTHLRALVHTALPEVAEDIKWGRTCFMLDGKILGNMAAFKEHCSFGFWSQEMTTVLAEDGVLGSFGAGSFGKLTNVAELPPEKAMVTYIQQAAALLRSGKSVGAMSDRTRKASEPVIAMPQDFKAALAKSKKAKATFDAFAPSCQREYLEWITTAKRAETREKRVTDAVAMISEGKTRNWKYETKR